VQVIGIEPMSLYWIVKCSLPFTTKLAIIIYEFIYHSYYLNLLIMWKKAEKFIDNSKEWKILIQ